MSALVQTFRVSRDVLDRLGERELRVMRGWWSRHGLLVASEDEREVIRRRLQAIDANDADLGRDEAASAQPGTAHLPCVDVGLVAPRETVLELTPDAVAQIRFCPGAVLSQAGQSVPWELFQPFLMGPIEEVLVVDRYLFASGNEAHLEKLFRRICSSSQGGSEVEVRIATCFGHARADGKASWTSEEIEAAFKGFRTRWAPQVKIHGEVYSPKKFKRRFHDRFVAVRPRAHDATYHEDGYLAFQIGAGTLRLVSTLGGKDRTVVARISPDDFALIIRDLDDLRSQSSSPTRP